MLSIEASQSTPYAPLRALGWPVTTLSVSPRQGVRASLWSWELLCWLDWWGEGASSGCCDRRGRLPAGSRALPAGPPHPVHATPPRLVPPPPHPIRPTHPLTSSTLLLLVSCPPFLIPYDLLTPHPEHTTRPIILGAGHGANPSLPRERSPRSPEPPEGWSSGRDYQEVGIFS